MRPTVGFAAHLQCLAVLWYGVMLAACGGGEAPSRQDPRNAGLPAPGSDDDEASVAPTGEWIILSRERVGPITENTTRAHLDRLFGSHNVRDTLVHIGEGYCAPGAVVFPASSDEVEITWKSEGREAPATVRIRQPGGRWVTDDGVHVGSTLEELVAIKGAPLTFGGLGWDYGGGAVWNGLSLQLEPDEEDFVKFADDPRMPEILGERAVSSDHPVIRGMMLRVVLIELAWAYPDAEVECPSSVPL